MQNPKFTPDFILEKIRKDKKDPRKQFMDVAARYYENDSDIMKRRRFFIGNNNEEIEPKRLSNSKIAHPFFPKLVDQKVNYLLAKELSIDCDDEKYAEHLYAIFDRAFMRRLRCLCTEAILCAVAWLQVYYDEAGNLAFKTIPSREIIPIWKDGDHLELRGVIRVYKDDPEDKIEHVEVYDDHTMTAYTLDSGQLKAESQHAHIQLEENGQRLDADWGRVPFVPFKYNAREIPLLKYIKPAIDDYDAITSDMSNAIKDAPNSLKVVRGYEGQAASDTAQESDKSGTTKFIHNLHTLGVAFVGEGGDIEIKQVTLDTNASEAHLARLRKDIYDAACGVDAQDAATGNTSGVAIRLRYSDLDMNCAAIGNEFSASLENLLYFINIDAAARHIGNFDGMTATFVFNTDVSVNEAETIQMCADSKDMLSQRTILANHPWVKSVDDEIERIDEELGGEDGRDVSGEVSPNGAMSQAPYAPTPSAGQSPATPQDQGNTEA